MAKVILISLYSPQHIGIRYLSSSLIEEGHKVSIIYFKNMLTWNVWELSKNKLQKNAYYHKMIGPKGEIEICYPDPITVKEEELLITLIKNLQPDLIGITLTTLILETAILLTRKIKDNFNVPVIWGGIEATADPEKCIEYPDMICIGEGERAMVELADAIEKNEDFSYIRDLWVKKGNKIIKNQVRALVQNLDKLPIADTIEGNKYLIEDNQLIRLKGKNVFKDTYLIMSSRGCPFSCSYCCHSFLRDIYKNQRYLRRRSVQNVIEELKRMKKYGSVSYIYFFDDVFTFNRKWISHFSEIYKKEISLPFRCYVHPNLVDRESLIALKSAGLNLVVMGIQSGSCYITKEVYNRRVSNESIIKCAQLLRELGIKYYLDIITNNPLEEEKDCKATLDLLLSLPVPIEIDSCIGEIGELVIFPGTKIGKIVNGKKSKLEENTRSFYNKLYLLALCNIPRKWIKLAERSSFLYKFQGILKVILVLHLEYLTFVYKLKNLYYPTFVYKLKIFIKFYMPGMREVWEWFKISRKKE